MKGKTGAVVDIDHPSTWVKYRKKMCEECNAVCCTMPVEVRMDDLVRMGVIDEFDRQEAPKKIAKRLKRSGIIDHFNYKGEVFTLSRRANDDCIYLEGKTRRCTIYDNRPRTCRNHPQIGPRSGFCAFIKRDNGQ